MSLSEAGEGGPTPLRVILKRGKSKPLWIGHPWVFSRAIADVRGELAEHGGPCLVEDDRGNVVGAGHYNPRATIAVRILEHRRTTERDFQPRGLEALLRPRLRDAIAARATFGLPGEGTDAYRVVNAEGDRLTGLIVDRLGSTAVIHTGSRAMYQAREQIAEAVAEELGTPHVVALVGAEAARLEGLPATRELLLGPSGGEVPEEILELGLRYRLPRGGGQKTGYYLDQRENRRRFGAHCAGQRVLDLYCYVGGFALNAARAGAAAVTCVDSSPPAVEALRASATLNALQIEAHQDDVVTFLKEACARGQTWDRIVVDPPKLASKRAHLDKALAKYTQLNALALACLAPGGLLLSCSCSQHVSVDDLLRVLTEAGHRHRRPVRVHAVWGPGPDHPYATVAPEGDYLKAALVGCPQVP